VPFGEHPGSILDPEPEAVGQGHQAEQGGEPGRPGKSWRGARRQGFGGKGVRRRFDRVRILLEELTDHGVRIQADGGGIGFDERSPEDACRPFRQITPFEGAEMNHAHLGNGGDRFERNLPPFALMTKPFAEILSHISPRFAIQLPLSACPRLPHVEHFWSGSCVEVRYPVASPGNYRRTTP
jgi:hypothetical protein